MFGLKWNTYIFFPCKVFPNFISEFSFIWLLLILEGITHFPVLFYGSQNRQNNNFFFLMIFFFLHVSILHPSHVCVILFSKFIYLNLMRFFSTERRLMKTQNKLKYQVQIDNMIKGRVAKRLTSSEVQEYYLSHHIVFSLSARYLNNTLIQCAPLPPLLEEWG